MPDTLEAIDALLELLAVSNLQIRMPDGRWEPFSVFMADGKIISNQRLDARRETLPEV